MIGELCTTLGCHRERGHSERTHAHRRWVMDAANGSRKLDAIEWPVHGDLVVIDRSDANRRK